MLASGWCCVLKWDQAFICFKKGYRYFFFGALVFSANEKASRELLGIDGEKSVTVTRAYGIPYLVREQKMPVAVTLKTARFDVRCCYYSNTVNTTAACCCQQLAVVMSHIIIRVLRYGTKYVTDRLSG